MNIVDIIIVILIIFGGLIGMKRGFTKQLVSFIGFIAIIIIAFMLKNPVSTFFYENLPFFTFGGVFKGLTVLNIALYEFLAFFVVLAVLGIILRILLFATSVFEKILTMTIILGIPSKILGGILGMIQWFIICFVVLYALSLPMFNIKIVNESSFRKPILAKTPILSQFVDKSMNVFNDFAELKAKYETTPNANQFNLETLDLFLQYKVVTPKSVEKLDKKDKLKIDNIDSVLDKYRKE